MREFEVTVTLRNNLLKSRRLAVGMSASDVAKDAGMSYGNYIALESMRDDPISKRQRWRPVALALAKYWGVNPEELFPEAVRNVKQRTATRCFSSEELGVLSLSEHTQRMLVAAPDDQVEREELEQTTRQLLEDVLSPRERQAICLRFGIDTDELTLKETGKVIGVTRERTRQIEAKALRKMRYACRCQNKYLQPFNKRENVKTDG